MSKKILKSGEKHSVLAGFSLEPDALEKSVDEWQPVLEEFIPGVKVLSTFGHDWGGDDLSQGLDFMIYLPHQAARHKAQGGGQPAYSPASRPLHVASVQFHHW